MKKETKSKLGRYADLEHQPHPGPSVPNWWRGVRVETKTTKNKLYWCNDCQHWCSTGCCDHWDADGRRIRCLN